MLRILRAFAWMRWRIVVNSLERTGARDTVERFSVAFEQIGPLIAIVLLVPTAFALAALAGYAGSELAGGSRPIAFEIIRYLLLLAVGLSVAGPIILPAGERTNAVRLLLLPIPRGVLYIGQCASALTDPWILLTIPMVLAVPVGLALGGALRAAAVALVAGMLFVLVLVGISSLATTILHLLMRDRRRGELLALLFILVVPAMAILPTAMNTSDRDTRRDAEHARRGRRELAPWMIDAGARAFALMPSEMLIGSIQAARRGEPLAATRSGSLLVLVGAVLHVLGAASFGKLLDTPATAGGRRSAGQPARVIRLPGMSAGASAVAISQIRLALRTPRGRSVLISPFVVFVMFAVLMLRGSGDVEFGFIKLQGGLALATFGSVVCLLALLPFAMNQFAIDGPGLTLQFLSPLSDREILMGKAVGNGIVASVPALVCIAIGFLLFPAGSAALWVSLPLGVIATYSLAAPVAAVISAVLPRAVDLNSIGQKSNAHAMAGLLGMLVFAAAGAPAVLLALVSAAVFDRAFTTFLLLLGWCVVAMALARLLLTPVAALVQRRRENLGMVVSRAPHVIA